MSKKMSNGQVVIRKYNQSDSSRQLVPYVQRKSETTVSSGSASPQAKKTTASAGPKPKIKKTKRVIRANKGEDIRIKKLIVDKNDIIEIQHGGGKLVIEEVEVKKGATFTQDLSKAPKGFVIGRVHGSGTMTNKF